MSPCSYLPTISSYHDGELSPGQSADVAAHLATCAACAAELRSLQRVSAVFASAAPVALSPMGRARVLQGFRAGERNRQIAVITRPFAAAASIILAVGLPLLMTDPSGSSTGVNTAAAGAPVWETAIIARDESVPLSTRQDQLAEWVRADLTVAGR